MEDGSDDGNEDNIEFNVDADDDSVTIPDGKGHTLMTDIARVWIKRKKVINSDYAITAWALLILPEIRCDVKKKDWTERSVH